MKHGKCTQKAYRGVQGQSRTGSHPATEDRQRTDDRVRLCVPPTVGTAWPHGRADLAEGHRVRGGTNDNPTSRVLNDISRASVKFDSHVMPPGVNAFALALGWLVLCDWLRVYGCLRLATALKNALALGWLVLCDWLQVYGCLRLASQAGPILPPQGAGACAGGV